MDAFIFLFTILHHFISTIFIARLAFQWSGITMTNPIAQFVLRFTQTIINPVQNILPTIKRFNFSVLAIVMAINVFFVALYIFLFGAEFSLPLVIKLAAMYLTQQVLDFVFWSIIIQVIFSWLPNAHYHPLAQIVSAINHPLLRPIKKILPVTGGFDFSPIVVIIAIKVIELLLSGSSTH